MPLRTVRALVIHLLLMAAFALSTFGLLEWYRIGFTLLDLARLDMTRGSLGVHPLVILILGVAMIPPAFRELDLLERNQPTRQEQDQRQP